MSPLVKKLQAHCLVCAICLPPACVQTHSEKVNRNRTLQRSSVRLHLPESIQHRRSEFETNISTATQKATAWFERSGLDLSADEVLIEDAHIFDNHQSGRAYLARHFGIKLQNVPLNFAGVVDGKTLMAVTPSLYQEIFENLYKNHIWTRSEYEKLLIHETAHAIHAKIARDRFGSEDAMGPRWFLEGLAVVCASQFLSPDTPQPRLSWNEIEDYIAKDSANQIPIPIYPVYGLMVRSLQERIATSWLIEHAGDINFTAIIKEAFFNHEE